MWDEYSQELSKSYKVVMIDLPGHGESGFFSEGTTLELMAKVVNTILTELDILKASIVGHSMGGYVSLAFAELFPHKLDRLILFHSSAYADTDAVIENRITAIEVLKKHPMLYVKHTVNSLFRAETIDNFKDSIAGLVDSAQKVNPTGYIEAVKAMKSRPNRFYLLSENIRTFFVAGRFDPVIPEDLSSSQIEKLPKGNGVFLEEAGHMGFVEEKEKALKIISYFLEC